MAQVLEERRICINTNSVEIYKILVNGLESATGQPQGMPSNVTIETTLCYSEVKQRLEKSLNDLKRLTTIFFATIIKEINKFFHT